MEINYMGMGAESDYMEVERGAESVCLRAKKKNNYVCIFVFLMFYNI